MNDLVTVSEVLEVVRLRRALMAPETAGYLVLATADQLTRAPRRLELDSCTVAVEGGKVALAAGAPAAAADVERALRKMLRLLLQVTSGGVPALQALTAGEPGESLDKFVAELESALIPVNRSAAARALSRLARDTLKARHLAPRAAEMPPQRERGDAVWEPDAHVESAAHDEEHDTEPIVVLPTSVPPVQEVAQAHESDPHADATPLVSAVAPAWELHATPVQPHLLPDLDPPAELSGRWGSRSFPRGAPTQQGVDELLERFIAPQPHDEALLVNRLRDMAGVGEQPATLEPTPFESLQHLELASPTPSHPSVGRGPPARVDPQRAALEHGIARQRRANAALAAGKWVLLVALALAGAVVLFRPPRFLSPWLKGGMSESDMRLPDAPQDNTRPEPAACRATVVVSDIPSGAEVLMREGSAPVDVTWVPWSARLEFVTLAEGYAPRRAFVPLNASWGSPDSPRFEIAVQMERTRAKGSASDAWPARTLNASIAGGAAMPGPVHVVTSPPAAEVWLVLGAAPEATIEGFPCATAMELLVAGPSAGQPIRRRLRIDSGQTTPTRGVGSITARVSAN